MRKKITLRQPTAEAQRQAAANAWVTGTSQTETQIHSNTEMQNSAQKQARLTIDLPQELHSRFKAACAQQRTKMKDEVLAFIEDWTQKHR